MVCHDSQRYLRRAVYVPRGNPSTIFDSWSKEKKEPALVRVGENAREDRVT